MDLKKNIFVHGHVERSINLSHHSLSTTLFWPEVANWTMEMCFSTTLLAKTSDSSQSANVSWKNAKYIRINTHIYFEYKSNCWSIFKNAYLNDQLSIMTRISVFLLPAYNYFQYPQNIPQYLLGSIRYTLKVFLRV